MDARKRPVLTWCRKCGGHGGRSTPVYGESGNLKGWRNEWCEVCNRTGKAIDEDVTRSAYFEFQSPAWRAAHSIEDRWKSMKAGWHSNQKTAPATVQKYEIFRARLVDDTHGVVTMSLNGLPRREYRWILVASDGAKQAWYFYSREYDGSWPEPSIDEEPEPAAPALSAAISDRLSKAWRERMPAPAPHRFSRCEWSGTTCVVYVEIAADDEGSLLAASKVELEPCSRAVLLDATKANAVILAFVANYRDPLGVVTKQVYKAAKIDRTTLDMLNPKNLTEAEIVTTWLWSDPIRSGEVLWWKK